MIQKFSCLLLICISISGCQTAPYRDGALNEGARSPSSDLRQAEHSILDLGPLSLLGPAPSHWAPRRSFTSPAQDAVLFRSEEATLRYRIESFGKMVVKFRIEMNPQSISKIRIVRGDLARLVLDANKTAGTVELTEPGVHYIDVTSPKQVKNMIVVCLQACDRPAVGIETLASSMKPEDQKALLDFGAQWIQEKISDPMLANKLGDSLKSLADSPQIGQKLKFFPTLSLNHISALQIPLTSFKDEKRIRKEDPKVLGQITELLSKSVSPVQSSTESPIMLGQHRLTFGHFEDASVTDVQKAQSRRLAEVLTALSVNNGSKVLVGNREIMSASSLFQYLMSTGHEVQMRFERTFANFLGFMLDDIYDLRWPTWIQTQVQSSKGENLKIPTLHGQIAWRVRGPLVDARVTFYLGISGAAFFAQTDRRPAWTGMKSIHETTKSEEIAKAVEFATVYLRRNRIERETIAKGLPADGYGILGICNDSTAVIEAAMLYPNRSYPLLRRKKISQSSQVTDSLSEVFGKLESDLEGLGNSEIIFKRIYSALPYRSFSKLIWDESLLDTFKEIEQKGKSR